MGDAGGVLSASEGGRRVGESGVARSRRLPKDVAGMDIGSEGGWSRHGSRCCEYLSS